MLNKLNPKSKRIVALGVVVLLGAVESYAAHCGATGECPSFTIPPIVYSILAGLGITAHYVAKPKA